MADTSIPDVIAQMDAEALHRYAHGLLQEMGGDKDRAFAVATAGAHYVDDKDINSKCLFDVIREISEDTTAANTLTAVIDQLAQLAGSAMSLEQARSA